MKRKKIATLWHSLCVFLVGMGVTLGLYASETTPPPEGLDFSVLETNNPTTSFEVGEGGFKSALEGSWKVITLSTFTSVKWGTTYKDDCFNIAPTKFSATQPYCSYLVSPALDLAQLNGSALTFSLLATSPAGDAPLKVLIIDNMGNTLRELMSVTQTSESNSSYFPQEVSMPNDLTGVGFIAFVAQGNKENRKQFKINNLRLATASAEVTISSTPQEGLFFDSTNVGEVGATKEVEVFIKNSSSAPTVSLVGDHSNDFRLLNPTALTSMGGKLQVVFEPKAAGDREAQIEIIVGSVSHRVPLSGKAIGTATGENPDPQPELADNVELLNDPYFYEFNAENQPTGWQFEGNVSKIEKGYNANTGFAIRIDASGSTSNGVVFQTVSLKGKTPEIKVGEVFEGVIHFRSLEPKLANGVVRLACQWLNDSGEVIPSAEDAFINNSHFFDRHKAWDEVRFRTIMPTGATQFRFKVETQAGSLVELDDFNFLRLTRVNANSEFISVLPHIATLNGAVGQSSTHSILVQGMKLPHPRTPMFKTANGEMSMMPAQIPEGNSVNTYTLTITPTQKGAFYNGYMAQFLEENPVATASLNAFIIDATTPPTVQLSAATPVREMESFPNETDEQTLSFDVSGVIESATVAIQQEEAGIFMINTSSFFYSVKQDKVLNNSVKITFRPKEEKEYSATITITSARMEPFTLQIKGKGRKNTEGWVEKFTADKPLDSRFVGEAWNNYHLFDRGYYLLNGSWSAGKVTLDAKGVLECDEWFANGVETLSVQPLGSAPQLRLEYTIDGGGHWHAAEDFNRSGVASIKSHRPTRFRLVNKMESAVELTQISLVPNAREQRIEYPELNNEAMLTGVDTTPLTLLNETFNGTRHTRGLNLPGWQTLALQADRPFWGWAQKNKTTMEIEEQCAQISFLNSLNKDDKREHQAWLISPTLSYKNALSKILTFRLRYELPTENGNEKFGVFIITEKEGSINPQYLDITRLLLVENIENDTWYDYYVDLSKVEGIQIEDLFHVGFSFYSPVGGNATSLTFMIDDVTFGRTDITEINVDKDLISFLFKVDQECTPQLFTVTTKNPKHPIALTMVPSRMAEQFKLSTTQLPKEGGDVAVGFKSKDDAKRAAALLVQSRGSASKLVRLIAQIDNSVEMPESLAASRVYPTVVEQTLHVEGLYNQYYIYSLQGEWLQQGNATHKIEVGHLPKGTYIIRLVSEDGGVATHRFIRQ